MVTVIQVKAKPNARTSVLEELSPGVWQAHLKSPPVDGKANKELIALVAAYFGRPKAAVSIKSGGSARIKRVAIEGTGEGAGRQR
jgi:uncharacterized protein